MMTSMSPPKKFCSTSWLAKPNLPRNQSAPQPSPPPLKHSGSQQLRLQAGTLQGGLDLQCGSVCSPCLCFVVGRGGWLEIVKVPILTRSMQSVGASLSAVGNCVHFGIPNAAHWAGSHANMRHSRGALLETLSTIKAWSMSRQVQRLLRPCKAATLNKSTYKRRVDSLFLLDRLPSGTCMYYTNAHLEARARPTWREAASSKSRAQLRHRKTLPFKTRVSSKADVYVPTRNAL